MALDELRNNKMMAHLTGALERGEDIGHYGRLVFAMVARHFLSKDELCTLLSRNLSETEARALCRQVAERDYNPPRPSRILQWQREQSFPICPEEEQCNVYRDLRFPDHVYQHIQEYYERKAEQDPKESRAAS